MSGGTPLGGGDDRITLDTARRIPRASDRVHALALPVRFLVVSVLVAGALLTRTSGTRHVWIAFVAAGVWAPIAGMVDAAVRRRPDSQTLAIVGAVVDFAMVALVAVAVPDAWPLTLGPLVLIVAYKAYIAGPRVATVFALLAGVLAIGVAHHRGPTTMPVSGLTLGFPVVLASMILLQQAVVAVRRETEGGLIRLNVRSDALLTGVAEAIVVTSRRGQVRDWNPGAERTFACTAEEARGSLCSQALGLYADVTALDCTRGCPLLARSGGEAADHEVWRARPDGTRQPLLATALPVTDQAGTIVEVVHSFRDITRLKQADEAKTLFLATASHELKTPLAVMLGFSELLLDAEEMGPDEKRTALTAIRARSMQLTEIVNRMLLSSRIEAGRVELHAEPLEISGLVAERVESFRAATARDVRITCASEVPAAAADGDAFVSVIDHLIDNAVKYSGAAETVDVTVTFDADSVITTVADRGIGMSEEEADRCFEPFWQAESIDSRRFGGTGIGLYVVRALVEGMGGSIAVRSAPGSGSTFTVMLRRADRPPDGELGDGDPSIIQEFMRQLGVPARPAAEEGARP